MRVTDTTDVKVKLEIVTHLRKKHEILKIKVKIKVGYIILEAVLNP